MIKIAQEFFQNNSVSLDTLEDFFKSDLFLYFKLLYGSEPVFSKENGFIKVINDKEKIILTEHIYYDYSDGKVEEGFITLPNLEITGTKIVNSNFGKQLSKKGYIQVDIPESYQELILGSFPSLDFKKTPLEEGLGEPSGTFKFHKNIWSEDLPNIKNQKPFLIYYGIKDLIKSFLEFSEVAKSFSAYDLNILEWTKGRSMTAHNGIDYKSFINLITYNTNHCSISREIMVGEYDWYEVVFNCLFENNFEKLMDIRYNNTQLDSFEVETSKAILINVFNPRFYHQVGEMRGDGKLYVCTSNMSFKSITDKYLMKW